MKLEVLGCAGGEGINYRATSFLLNDTLLIDAGAVADVLTLEQQSQLRHALISHAHLDHIKDLGFVVDNTFNQRRFPLKVVSTSPVIEALRNHYFNWVIWPDFTRLPDAENPVLELVDCEPSIELDGLSIELIPVNHPGIAYGFLVEDPATDCSILISGDTGITEQIWQVARARSNLKAILADTAFPNDMEELAKASGHLTPNQLIQQLTDFGLQDTSVYCFHLKPAFHEQVQQDIRALARPNIRALEQGQQLRF